MAQSIIYLVVQSDPANLPAMISKRESVGIVMHKSNSKILRYSQDKALFFLSAYSFAGIDQDVRALAIKDQISVRQMMDFFLEKIQGSSRFLSSNAFEF